MKNYSHSIIIILLLSLNIFVIVKSNDKNIRINELEGIISESNEDPQEVSVLDTKEIQIKNFFSYEKEINSPLKLVAVIPESSCGACVLYDINLVDSFYESYPDNLIVYHIGDSNQNYTLQHLDIKFDYTVLDSLGNILQKNKYENIKIDQPTYLLIDNNRIIQDVHVTDLYNPESTDIFFKKMHSLMYSIQKD